MDRWLASHSGRSTHTERAPGTHWMGGLEGSRARLDGSEEKKIPCLPLPEIEP